MFSVRAYGIYKHSVTEFHASVRFIKMSSVRNSEQAGPNTNTNTNTNTDTHTLTQRPVCLNCQHANTGSDIAIQCTEHTSNKCGSTCRQYPDHETTGLSNGTAFHHVWHWLGTKPNNGAFITQAQGTLHAPLFHIYIYIYIYICACAQHERIWGNWDIAPGSLNIGTNWRSRYFYTPAALPPPKGPRYPVNMRLGEPHSRSGKFGEEKNLFVPQMSLSSNLQPVALLTAFLFGPSGKSSARNTTLSGVWQTSAHIQGNMEGACPITECFPSLDCLVGHEITLLFVTNVH
jgi:hypothetical protein